jgi:prepilin-type N-terminal cleavage/methylation domain-containing protein
MKKTAYQKRKKYFCAYGFTLLELVIVVAIIGIVSGVVFMGARAGEKALLLDRVAHKAAQDIRLALDFSFSARAFNNCPGSGATLAYAMHFQNENYQIADLMGGADINVDGATSYLLYVVCDETFEFDKDTDAAFRLVELEEGIEIKTLLNNGGLNSRLDIAFEPPDPLVHFEPASPPFAVVLAPVDAVVTGYEYRKTGDEDGWRNPQADCDVTNPALECPLAFSASGGDPDVVYDRYCTGSCGGSNKRSVTFTKIPLYSPSRVVTISEKGVIEVQ